MKKINIKIVLKDKIDVQDSAYVTHLTNVMYYKRGKYKEGGSYQ